MSLIKIIMSISITLYTDPTTVNLWGKSVMDNFTVVDVVEYLTGKKLETCEKENYADFLTFNTNLLRKGMLEQWR